MIACHAFRCGLKLNFSIKYTTCVLNRFGKYTTSQTFLYFHSNPGGDTTHLVYEGPLKKRIRFTKLLSLTSSMVGAAFLPTVLSDMGEYSMPMAVGFGLVCSVFLSTPLLLNWITKRYVLSLRYDPFTRKFHAITYNMIAVETEQTFVANDVTVPDIPGMLTSFHVKGKPLFVDAGMVKDPEAYSHMMGYDKPLDMYIKKDKEHNKS